MPPEVNALIKGAIKEHVKGEDVIKLFEAAEFNKWYGRLRFPVDKPQFEFVFRYGACQNFTRKIFIGNAEFELNIINDAIDFGKEKESGNNTQAK